MPINKGMMSSLVENWGTPPDFFAELNKEFGFTLDVCAQPHNAKVSKYFTPEQDGLAQDWGQEVCWMNPPYGRKIGDWMRKARNAAWGGGDRNLLSSSKDRYEMVARVCDDWRNKVYSRTLAIYTARRQPRTISTIPISGRNFQEFRCQ